MVCGRKSVLGSIFSRLFFQGTMLALKIQKLEEKNRFCEKASIQRFNPKKYPTERLRVITSMNCATATYAFGTK